MYELYQEYGDLLEELYNPSKATIDLQTATTRSPPHEVTGKITERKRKEEETVHYYIIILIFILFDNLKFI
jgi:hypothetical protein